MKTLRNFALIFLGLLIGFIANHFGIELALLIFLPAFLLWFTFWDDLRFRQAERKRHYQYYQNNHESYHYK